jgi:protein-tyrosine phosphatase
MTTELAKLNFRDVGGLRTEEGSLVRSGMIFRSEGPASFEPIHKSELAALGVQVVCDLRADTERQRVPNDWAGTARQLNLDINADLRVNPSELLKTLGADRSADALKRANLSNYAAMPAAFLPHLRELTLAIADGQTPILIHCTAGKDRTGVLVALLLMALRVPEELVIADYLRSDVYRQNLRLQEGLNEQIEGVFGFLPDDAFIDALIGVDIDLLDAAIQAMHREWGSVDGYLRAAGIEADLLDRYRDVMTVQPGESDLILG